MLDATTSIKHQAILSVSRRPSQLFWPSTALL